MTTTSAAVQESLYIGGAWSRPEGDAFEVFDPSDEHVLAHIGSATDAQVHEALLAAREAQHAWARAPAVVRGKYLRAMADVVLANKDRLASLIVSEVGKPIKQAADELDFAFGFSATTPSGTGAWRERSCRVTCPARAST